MSVLTPDACKQPGRQCYDEAVRAVCWKTGDLCEAWSFERNYIITVNLLLHSKVMEFAKGIPRRGP